MSYDSQIDDVERMEAELVELRAALRPFAEHADEIAAREASGRPPFRFDDTWPNPVHDGLTVGMFRKAREVLGIAASPESVHQLMAAPSEVMPVAKIH